MKAISRMLLMIGLACLLNSCAIVNARYRSKVVNSMSNMSQIGVALTAYANDHKGNYPDSLNKFNSQFLEVINLKFCPVTSKEYRYLGKGRNWTDADASSAVLLESKLENSTLILCTDGHVEEVKK